MINIDINKLMDELDTGLDELDTGLDELDITDLNAHQMKACGPSASNEERRYD